MANRPLLPPVGHWKGNHMSTAELQPNWFRRYAYPLTVFSISRIGLFLLAYLSLVLIPIKTGLGLWRNYPQNLFLDGWVRWDSGWFSAIIQNGYTNIATLGQQRDTAFFPLYPLLVRVMSAFPQNISLSGLLISNISFLIAVLLLYQIVHDHYGKETAERSVALLAFNPFSLFFSAMYSESLFLMTVMAAFYFAERKRWVWAGLSAAAAGATRVVGIVAVIGLLLVYMEQIAFDWRKIRANILWMLVGLVGPGSYMLFLGMKFGNPLQFVKSQYVPGWAEGVNLQSAIETIKAALFSPASHSHRTNPCHGSASLVCLHYCIIGVGTRSSTLASSPYDLGRIDHPGVFFIMEKYGPIPDRGISFVYRNSFIVHREKVRIRIRNKLPLSGLVYYFIYPLVLGGLRQHPGHKVPT